MYYEWKRRIMTIQAQNQSRIIVLKLKVVCLGFHENLRLGIWIYQIWQFWFLMFWGFADWPYLKCSRRTRGVTLDRDQQPRMSGYSFRLNVFQHWIAATWFLDNLLSWQEANRHELAKRNPGSHRRYEEEMESPELDCLHEISISRLLEYQRVLDFRLCRDAKQSLA